MFGLVRASGTKLNLFETAFRQVWKDFGFDFQTVRLSDVAFSNQPLYEAIGTRLPPEDRRNPAFDPAFQSFPSWEERRQKVNYGFRARTLTFRNDILLRDALAELGRIRTKLADRMPDTAWSLRSLMHPSEVNLLRDVYGGRYFTIGVYEPRGDREANIAQELRTEQPSASEKLIKQAAQYLLDLDDSVGVPGVKIQSTFEKSDLFVDISRPKSMHFATNRFVAYLLGYPFGAPTLDEFGMAIAWTARRSSSALSRAVGAAALSPETGAILALGYNDVPRSPLAGPWPDNDVRVSRPSRGPAGDYREHLLGADSSDRRRLEVFGDLIQRLKAANVVSGDLSSDDIYALDGVSEAAQFDAIEYGRTVHAEAALIASAASRGISLAGATLYVTTFPCHECSRIIIQSGISRVVFVEPYPKSLAPRLYSQQIYYVDSPDKRRRRPRPLQVKYEPFVGIAPARFADIFSFEPRKEGDRKGGKRALDGEPSRWPPETGYAPRESILSLFLSQPMALQAMEQLEKLAIHEGNQAWKNMLDANPEFSEAVATSQTSNV